MKRNFNSPIFNFDGTPVERTVYKTDATGKHLVDEKGAYLFARVEQVVLKNVMFELLGGRYPSDMNISGAQLLARYAFAMKLKAAGDGAVDLDHEDTAAIHDVLEKAASPLVYGMTLALLKEDPPPAASTPATDA